MVTPATTTPYKNKNLEHAKSCFVNPVFAAGIAAVAGIAGERIAKVAGITAREQAAFVAAGIAGITIATGRAKKNRLLEVELSILTIAAVKYFQKNETLVPKKPAETTRLLFLPVETIRLLLSDSADAIKTRFKFMGIVLAAGTTAKVIKLSVARLFDYFKVDQEDQISIGAGICLAALLSSPNQISTISAIGKMSLAAGAFSGLKTVLFPSLFPSLEKRIERPASPLLP